MSIDLNISHIRTQIDEDFKQIPDTEDGRTQKNILTWLELRDRINKRVKEQKEKGYFSFTQCLSEWSSGDLKYSDLLKRAKILLKKNAIKDAEQIKEVEWVFDNVGTKPVEAKELKTFKDLSNHVIGYFKNMFKMVSNVFKRKQAIDKKEPTSQSALLSKLLMKKER